MQTYKGEKYFIKELAEMAGISVACFKSRIKSGWNIEEVMNGERITLTACQAKRPPKARKLKMYATCNYRCNAK